MEVVFPYKKIKTQLMGAGAIGHLGLHALEHVEEGSCFPRGTVTTQSPETKGDTVRVSK